MIRLLILSRAFSFFGMEVNTLEHFYQLGWTLDSAGGASGEAYMAQHDGHKLFLKRNSSPFLAALSAEGIVPKLIWTKRIETGEVVTAQHWKNGRSLEHEEMNSKRVATMMKKIHSSRQLLNMLKRMEMKPMYPEMLQHKLNASLSRNVLANATVRKALTYLEEHHPELNPAFYTVCHGDVNHNNWLLSEQDELFLVDWEGAMIADPAIDLGMILYTYIQADEWSDWMAMYGMQDTLDVRKRMKWYTIIQTIALVQWYEEKNHYKEMNDWLDFLNEVLMHNRLI